MGSQHREVIAEGRATPRSALGVFTKSLCENRTLLSAIDGTITPFDRAGTTETRILFLHRLAEL
jgi:hypothetical protein